MRKRTGKTLALLLALVMLIGLLPGMSAWAAAVPSCNPANGGTIEYQGEYLFFSRSLFFKEAASTPLNRTAHICRAMTEF